MQSESGPALLKKFDLPTDDFDSFVFINGDIFQSHKELKGVFNCTAPNPIDNKTLMKTFRQAMKTKIGLPSPAWLLKIGAVIIKTEPELILKSCWVVPEKLLESGYAFKYPTLDTALKNILDNEQ